MSLVSFPPEFIATAFPGYFFNVTDEKLYSMKIDGILKPLKYQRPNQFNHMWRHPVKLRDGSEVTASGGYYVSVKGRRKFYAIEKLKDLPHVESIVPVKETE